LGMNIIPFIGFITLKIFEDDSNTKFRF